MGGNVFEKTYSPLIMTLIFCKKSDKENQLTRRKHYVRVTLIFIL